MMQANITSLNLARVFDPITDKYEIKEEVLFYGGGTGTIHRKEEAHI